MMGEESIGLRYLIGGISYGLMDELQKWQTSTPEALPIWQNIGAPQKGEILNSSVLLNCLPAFPPGTLDALLRRCREQQEGGGRMIGIVYSTVVGTILLFPWVVLALMVAGTLWERARVPVE